MARNFIRKFANEAVKGEALPFDKIPGPRGFLGIGTFYNYFKAFGELKLQILINIYEHQFQASTALTSFTDAE